MATGADGERERPLSLSMAVRLASNLRRLAFDPETIYVPPDAKK